MRRLPLSYLNQEVSMELDDLNQDDEERPCDTYNDTLIKIDCMEISVAVLAAYCSPFERVCWHLDLDSPITKNEVHHVLEGGTLEDKERHSHIQGIVHYIRQGWTQPLALDVGDPDRGSTSYWIVEDGNHRLAAALYMGLKTVQVSLRGSLRQARYLGLLPDDYEVGDMSTYPEENIQQMRL
jgi:hypothetical protein